MSAKIMKAKKIIIRLLGLQSFNHPMRGNNLQFQHLIYSKVFVFFYLDIICIVLEMEVEEGRETISNSNIYLLDVFGLFYYIISTVLQMEVEEEKEREKIR
jgi:hypothetical protein